MKTSDRGGALGRRSGAERTIGRLSVAVGAVTLAVGINALASPALMQASTRNLTQLRAGEWWRLITPVFVQPDGWGQLVFNLLGIVAVGTALERRTSRRAWTFVYLLGGIGGILAASRWQPADHSGGSSDAVAALIGAFCVLFVIDQNDRPVHRQWGDWLARLYCVFFAGYLTALDLGGVWWSILVGNATIVAFAIARRALSQTAMALSCLLFVVAAGVTMVLQHDGHGVGIIAGAGTAALMLWRRRGHPGRRTADRSAEPGRRRCHQGLTVNR